MTKATEPRPTQTKVKHQILDNYLKGWGGIIMSGLRRQAAQRQGQALPVEVHLVYVDCFASTGRFVGEQEDAVTGRPLGTVFGSAIIGVRALDSFGLNAAKWGISLKTNAILIEKGVGEFAELQESLRLAGLSSRIVMNDDFDRLADGQIAILNTDSTALVSKLVRYTQSSPSRYAFYFLDPYGPTGIPRDFVAEIVGKQHHDAIIYMPYLDLHKKTGLVSKLAQSSSDRKLIGHYDRMFGDKRWQAIVGRMEAGVGDEEWEEYMAYLEDYGDDTSDMAKVGDLELELVNAYAAVLREIDVSLIVKSIPLHIPDKDRTMYHLYLTTHDPNGALKMNKDLWDAGLEEFELRQRLREAKRRVARDKRNGVAEQLEMFEMFSEAPVEQRKTKPPRPAVETIADEIVKRFEGRALTRKEIYRGFADDYYFAPEIDNALAYLAKNERAEYSGKLSNSTVITIKVRASTLKNGILTQ